MPTIITGQTGTANILADRRKIDMADKIALLDPDAAPFTVLMMRMKKKVAINPEYNWMEDELMPRVDAINNGAGYNNTATSLVVDNGSYFTAGDIVIVERTNEHIYVSSVSTNTLTVVRGFGTTAAAAMVDNDPLIITGNTNEEGATVRTIKNTKKVKKTNYTQIFRLPFGATNTLKASELYGGDDMTYQRMINGINHRKDMERTLIFGEPKEDTTGTHPKRTTGGLDYWISTNRTDAGGLLTEGVFDNFLERIFLKGRDTKLLLASPIVLSAITSWAKDKLRLIDKQSGISYGVTLREYVTPFGTLLISMSKLLDATLEGRGNRGYVVDMDKVTYRFLTGRDTHINTNIQANDADSQTDEYLTEAGLQLENESAHGVIYNVTSY